MVFNGISWICCFIIIISCIYVLWYFLNLCYFVMYIVFIVTFLEKIFYESICTHITGVGWGESRGEQIQDEGNTETAGLLPVCPAQLWEVIRNIH